MRNGQWGKPISVNVTAAYSSHQQHEALLEPFNSGLGRVDLMCLGVYSRRSTSAAPPHNTGVIAAIWVVSGTGKIIHRHAKYVRFRFPIGHASEAEANNEREDGRIGKDSA